ncbi:murein biosynthesis integral membrane protein MurJ [Henriciella mobilis]|uniref:murein biosynthesis integral membrane protein MurJ n=1 Tax=Henriciella mobilis TaxID=2305467 RepID=UPI000E66A93D|nr:murein biosynthesis integral membrane protein MurJ [Henriciella mobilis]RIJ17506.1 murein biosynthesis integral membrane protein MurJ [Henriciella mobilis]RIJ25506.1 murein biosynthesis integral membrane protein MurJ [Henriciella mobilis]
MSVLRNTLTQSTWTLGSRLLGFLRDVVILAKLGAGPVADAFFTALMFPNLFRRVFAEGAFAQAFVPAYSRTLEAEGPEAAKRLAEETLRGLFAVTAFLVVIAQVAMPWIMILLHGGYRNDPVHFPLAILLTQITMPYLSFMALAALLSGVLNSGGRFAMSAAAPTLLNFSLLIGAFIGGNNYEVARSLAVAVSVAGLLQVALLWYGVSRQKIRLRLGFPKLTPGVKRVAALAVPGTIAASGMQINILVSQALASFETGAKTWLYSADRLYQLPLGLVGVAVGLAILPRLSRAARSDDQVQSQSVMDNGVGLAMALTVPAAAALMAAPFLFVDSFFTRGDFTSADAHQTARALFHFGWGVPAFVLIKVLAPGFFAREDTKTPMAYSLVSVGVNTVLGASLFFFLKSQGMDGFPGLAIATSTAAWVNAGLLFLGLGRRSWYAPGAQLIRRLASVLAASAALAALLWYLAARTDLIASYTLDSKFLAAVVIGFAGLFAYGVFALVFGAIRPSELKPARKG